MKNIFILFIVGLIIFSIFVAAQDEPIQTPDESSVTTDDGSQTQSQEENQIDNQQQIQNSGDGNSIQTQAEAVEFNKDPGMTPDSAFYFIDDLFERPGDDPGKAMDYKEEKIAEAKVMIEEGKPEKAQQVLEKALEYGDILEREVSPEIKERAKESSEQIINVLEDLKEQTSEEGWGIEGTFENNIEQEGKIATAAELASKINELCVTLAKLDPLQYSDVCKSESNSPRWMQTQDKQLTKEQEVQAKVFVDKLSQCMENPKDCDCKGMGVQAFEDFCVEKSSLAIECGEGNGEACKEMNEADPSDLLPDYLVGVFYDLKDKYSKSNFEKFMPPECEEAGANSPKDCEKVMFKLNAPKECIDAGLDGSSADDERKCGVLMFRANSPKECIDAGIDSSDPDAPRKCGKLMFKMNAPSQCLEAGLTGERRDDEAKCKQLMQGKGKFRERNTAQFNRDCNSIVDANEKIKCYEQFYNNAQVGFSDDFRERELNTREFAAKMGAANPEHPCPDGVCDQYESSHPGECPEDCGGERMQGEAGPSMQACQSQQQIENLKQDCINQGEDARVEDRGGCPWVVCVSQYQERTQQQIDNVYGDFNPYVKVDRQEPSEPMSPGGEYPQQPPQEPGTAPATEPAPPTEPAPTISEPSSEPAPVTGGVIFWNYYFK